jgi:hypothetical protein
LEDAAVYHRFVSGRPEDSAPRAPDGRLAAAILFAAVGAAIVSFQLFIPPIVGIADNYDYGRIMGRLGVVPQVSTKEERYFGWVVRRYRIDPEKVFPYGPSSTQTLLVRLALATNRLFSPSPVVDLRAVGVVNAVLYLGCLALIAGASRMLSGGRYSCLLALLLVAGTDVAYVSFFNSFYSEPAALIGLAGVIGFGLLASARPKIALAGLLLCSALTVFAKPQYGLLSLPLAVPIVAAGCRIGRWSGLAASIVGAAILVAGSLVYLARVPVTYKRVSLYGVVFSELLPHSPAPERDLDELGLDRALAGYSGTIAYQRNALSNPELDRLFYPRISFGVVARFYVRHPSRLVALLGRSSRSAFHMRPSNLGNFEKSTGLPPGSKSGAFAVWSTAKERFFPGSLGFLIVFFAGTIALAVWTRRALAAPATLLALWGAVLAVAASQFLICSAGEPHIELVRHLYLFQAAFDALLIGNLVALTSLAAPTHTSASPSGHGTG